MLVVLILLSLCLSIVHFVGRAIEYRTGFIFIRCRPQHPADFILFRPFNPFCPFGIINWSVSTCFHCMILTTRVKLYCFWYYGSPLDDLPPVMIFRWSAPPRVSRGFIFITMIWFVIYQQWRSGRMIRTLLLQLIISFYCLLPCTTAILPKTYRPFYLYFPYPPVSHLRGKHPAL